MYMHFKRVELPLPFSNFIILLKKKDLCMKIKENINMLNMKYYDFIYMYKLKNLMVEDIFPNI